MGKDSEKKAEKKAAATSRTMTPWQQMETLMDEFVPGRWMQRWGAPACADLWGSIQTPAPSIDVIDRDDEVVVKAELPGVRKDDVELSVTEHTLTLTGKTRHQETEETDSFYRREIRSGEFSRTVPLPAAVDTDKARAQFDDGVLVVSMPKVTKTSRKRVEIA